MENTSNKYSKLNPTQKLLQKMLIFNSSITKTFLELKSWKKIAVPTRLIHTYLN